MLELQIFSPQEDGFAQEIKWNKEEILAAVTGMVADYRNLVYTEETIKDAKADRARLNKLLDAFESERKRLKKLCEVPYKQFETEVKQVTDLIREPIGLIDAQIKEVEEVRKAEKREAVFAYYDAHVEGLRGILPFDKVLKPEYLNATKSMKSIEAEINELFAKVNSDMDTIEGLKTKYEFQVKDTYIRTLDLSLALKENARLEGVAEKLEQRRQEEAARAEALRQEEEEKKQMEAANACAPEPSEDQGNLKLPQPLSPDMAMAEQPVEKRYVVGLQVYGTKEELMAFQTFLQERHIRYEVTMRAKEEQESWQ